MSETKLTEKEILFCELYAYGDAPFGGFASKCYQEVFGDNTRNVKYKAMKLLARPEIQEYLNQMEELPFEEARYMKRFLAENLMHIVDYCSNSEFRDRKGTLLSPAPLRSVAVAASKALMDLYPVKEAQHTEVNINGGAEGGITFNVIVPDPSKNPQETPEK